MYRIWDADSMKYERTVDMIEFCHSSKNLYQKFLVAQNCIKKDYFFLCVRKLSRNLGPFSSIALVKSNIGHK